MRLTNRIKQMLAWLSVMTDKYPIHRNFDVYLLVLFILAGSIYVANTWSPSSYANALRVFQVQNYQPFFGKARSIRGDEWAVLTPYIQIAVKNKFQSTNNFSPYKENLRTFNVLPLKDWSLFFKPQMWGYFILPPAYAYSLYYYIFIFSFIFGYYKLLTFLRVDYRLALIGSLLLFFSRFTQVWWTNNAPVLSLAPWVMVAFLSPLRFYIKGPLFGYAVAVWLFSGLYPPFIIPTAFVFAVLWVVLRPDTIRLKNLFLGISATVLAVGLVYLYYQDIIPIVKNTVYPGQRISGGGGEHPFFIWAHFFPYITAIQFTPTIGYNKCEIGVMSSYFPLMVLIFSDAKSLINYFKKHLLQSALLLLGLMFMYCWVMLPVPATWGKIFLWHYVPPRRMLLGFGLLFNILFIILAQHTTWRIDAKRILLFVLFILGAWLGFKYSTTQGHLFQAWFDIVVLAPIVIVLLANWIFRKKFNEQAEWVKYTLGGAAVFTSLFTFYTFNPIQSARPIFQVPETPYLQHLRQLAACHPKGWLVVEGAHGAYFNGLGLNAINHVQLTPQLKIFREIFKDMPTDEFNFVFNRYAQIMPGFGEAKPRVIQGDAFSIPMERVAAAFSVEVGKPSLKMPVLQNGSIEHYFSYDTADGKKKLLLRGWADFSGLDKKQKLWVSSSGIQIAHVWSTRIIREDLAAQKREDLWGAGFVLLLTYDPAITSQEQILASLQLYAEDKMRGLSQIPFHNSQ